MSRSDDQNLADSTPGSEPLDQGMELKMFKIGVVTHLTLVGDESASRSSFGTQDRDFLYGLLHQVANAGSKGQHLDEQGIKFMLAFIKSGEPRDEIEASLLAQMAATQVAAMRYHNRLAHAESLHDLDHAERTLNKLMRTFATLAEALQRYRAITDWKVAVQNQNMSVSDGGAAMVGNVTRPALDPGLNRRLAPARSDAWQAPMEITGEAQRARVRRRRKIR